MKYGKPVVGCRAGGVPEIVEDGKTGFLVIPKDVISLSRAIEALLENEDTRELANYINQNFRDATFYSESKHLSLQLSALSPKNKFLPNQPYITKTYGFFNSSQKPIFNGLSFSFRDLYKFIFLPFNYNELINETEISSISKYNITSQADIVIPLLLKYKITHVILINNTNSDLFFTELYSIGFEVKAVSIYTIIDLKLREC